MASETYFATVTSADRVGIIAHLGEAVQRLGGEVIELSQTVMRGVFTVIFVGSYPAGTKLAVVRDALLDGCPELGVTVQAGVLDGPPRPAGQRFILTARGPHRPDLVAAFGGFFSGRGINVEDMYTRPEEGTPDQVVMVIQVRCPPQRDTRQLQLDLAELADELGIVAHLQHENVFLATNEVGSVRALSG